MKFTHAILPLLIASPAAFAEVTIKLPKEVNLLVVNEAVTAETDFNSDGLVKLPDGKSQLVFDIRKTFKPGSSQSKLVKTSPIIMTFDAKKEDLSLSLPKMTKEKDFRDYDKNPTAQLSGNGSITEVELDKLNKSFISLFDNYSYAAIEYNKNNAIYLTNSPVRKSIEQKQQTQSENNSIKNISLKAQFLDLPSEDKQEFLSWAVKNM